MRRKNQQLTLDCVTGVNPLRKHGLGLWGNPRVVMGIRVDKKLKTAFKLASKVLFGSTCNPIECYMAAIVGQYQHCLLTGVNPSTTVNIGEIKIERNFRERRKLIVERELKTVVTVGKDDKCFECDKKPKYKVFYANGPALLLCEDHYSSERFKLKGWVKL